MAKVQVIRTSERGWFAALVRAYKEERPVRVIDDAGVGFDPNDDTLFDCACRSHLAPREIIAACLAGGMSLVGALLMLAAVVDPEPASKVSLFVVTGGLLTASGTWAAVYILTSKKPPNVKVGPQGAELWWETGPA
jgi:hypothetical protein